MSANFDLGILALAASVSVVLQRKRIFPVHVDIRMKNNMVILYSHQLHYRIRFALGKDIPSRAN